MVFLAAGDGVGADAGAMLALPTEALVLDKGTFSSAGMGRGSPAPCVLPKLWPPATALLVIHRHAEERFADVLWPLRYGTDFPTTSYDDVVAPLRTPPTSRLRRLAAVAFVAKPSALGTPVELFGLPHIGAATGETDLKPMK